MKSLLPLLFAAFFLLIPTGCALGSRAVRSPSARSTAGDVSIAQTGDAKSAASAQSDTQTASVTLPAGSALEINEKLGTLSAKLSTATLLKLETRRDTVTGPQAFTPPAPPTPTDNAKGIAALWLRIGLAAGLAAGAFGLVKGWDFIAFGGGAVAAGCFVGLFLEAIPVWIWVTVAVGVTLAVVGPVIWHTKLKHTPFAPDPLPVTT